MPTSITKRRPDVLIVGGGLIGLFCADALNARGLQVEIWDGAETIPPTAGGAASWASAGMLAPLGEVPDDPSFLRVCLEARDLWRTTAVELESSSGLSIDYDATGALLVDRPDGRIERFEKAARQAGEKAFRVDHVDATALVPDLHPAVGPFLYLPGEHRVDNRLVGLALRRRLESRGVTFYPGRRVLKLHESRHGVTVFSNEESREAGAVLMTAGAWTSRIDGLPTLPVHPVKGQMMRFAEVEWPLTGCLRAGHLYAARRCADGRSGLLLGATVEPGAEYDTDVTGDGLAALLSFGKEVLPGLLARPVVESWAGLRPGSPDGRPLIGPIGERLWLATGHYRNGVLLAPWTGQFVADCLPNGQVPIGPAADLFAPERMGTGASSPEMAESAC